MMHTPILQKGFSMVEVLLSVALISIITVFSMPLFFNLITRNDLDVAAVSIAQGFRRAQTLAQTMEGDSPWGIAVQTGSLVLFKGVSYAGREIAFDEETTIPASIEASGLGEVVYAKFTGLPQATGTVTLTSSTDETRNITLNAQGTVTY